MPTARSQSEAAVAQRPSKLRHQNANDLAATSALLFERRGAVNSALAPFACERYNCGVGDIEVAAGRFLVLTESGLRATSGDSAIGFNRMIAGDHYVGNPGELVSPDTFHSLRGLDVAASDWTPEKAFTG